MRRCHQNIPDTQQPFTWIIRYERAQHEIQTNLHIAEQGQKPQVTHSDTRCFMNLHDPCNSVSLKEHLLSLLAAERQIADQQKAFVDLRFELAERALELDHVEMLRRLDLLNHAHEDARQKESSFVGREVYESQVKDNNKWRDEVNSSLSTRQGRSSVTSAMAGALGGLVLSAGLATIMFLAKAVLRGFPK
jgi:hypothetical protein